MPPELFTTLTSTDAPFHCLTCNHASLQQEVAELTMIIRSMQVELSVVPKLREEIAALTVTVDELAHRPNVQSSSASNERRESSTGNHNKSRHGPRSHQTTQRSYSSAAAAGTAAKPSRSSHSRHRSHHGPATTSHGQPQRVQENLRPNGGKPNPNLIKVVGARKIWGTLKVCSPAAVSSTILKLLPSGSTMELNIRRKTKLLGSKSIWWFVIHGSTESNLIVLEKEWEKVEIQTSWTLEPCLMAGPPPDTSLSQNPSSQIDETTSGSKSPTLSGASEKPTRNGVQLPTQNYSESEKIIPTSRDLPTPSNESQPQPSISHAPELDATLADNTLAPAHSFQNALPTPQNT